MAVSGDIIAVRIAEWGLIMKTFFNKYKHIWVFLYAPIYMIWFVALEQRTGVTYNYIHCGLDDLIPFCEYFIIPYLLWFAYVGGTVVILFTDTEHKSDFYHYYGTLVAGMTMALLIYTVWPNAQGLRPTTFAHDNIFTRLIVTLYHTDTSTNVCPSLHVYNSLVTHMAICKCHYFKEKKWVQRISLVLCILIILATVFLKQHSCIDGIASVIMFYVFYRLIWREKEASLSPQVKKA